MHECIKFILFWNDTLHVSDGLSLHHQEFKTVHTATGICQTDTAVCLLAGTKWNGVSISYPLASRQIYACCCMYCSELLMMDGKTVRNYERVCTSKHNCLCIYFIRLTTCFGHCGPSSGKKNL